MAAIKLRLTDGIAPISVADWRERARRRLPEVALSYVEGGAGDLFTLRRNEEAFRDIRLRQRAVTGHVAPDLSSTVAGSRLSLPVALAPIGASGLVHWDSDLSSVRAAERAGTRFTLSTAASYRVEEVAQAASENHWFQLYPLGTRERVALLMDRVEAAGYSALFMTIDVPVLGNREAERRWNLALPWTVTPGRALHLLRHLPWTYRALRHRRIAPIHFTDEVKALAGTAPPEDIIRNLLMADFNWDDLKWVRDRWKGPFYVKGILDPDDAARAVDEVGADGVVVSNHGGRQFDRGLATIEALPAIAERIGNRAEVLMDGGVRRGADVIAALALGAKAVFVGRPYLYGLAAAGEDGVSAVLDIFREEIERDLILMGCPSVADLDRSWIARGP